MAGSVCGVQCCRLLGGLLRLRHVARGEGLVIRFADTVLGCVCEQG
jgi:hypothetical protein